jgi:hypothetical protein
MNKLLFNFASFFLVLSTFGGSIFGLTFYFPHVILVGFFLNNIPAFFNKIFALDIYKVSLLLLILMVLLMSSVQTSVVLTLNLLLKFIVIFALYLLFLKGVLSYGPNFLYKGVWAAFIYMVYQGINWNFFNGELPLNSAHTFPFSHQDYGLQVTKIHGLFGLGDNYITHFIQSFTGFTKYLGYKFSGLSQEMSYMSAMVFPLLFLPISRRLKQIILLILFFSLSKSILGSLIFMAFYKLLTSFLSRKISAIVTIIFFIFIIFVASEHLVQTVPGTSVAARFYPLVYFVNEMSLFEQFFGLGFGYSVHHLPYIYENKILSSIGSIVIFHGVVGLAAYVLFFVILIKGSKYPAFVLAIFLCMYNWMYSISWPILSMFYALNFYYTNKIIKS